MKFSLFKMQTWQVITKLNRKLPITPVPSLLAPCMEKKNMLVALYHLANFKVTFFSNPASQFCPSFIRYMWKIAISEKGHSFFLNELCLPDTSVL